jgi:6-phosphogluconolactonase
VISGGETPRSTYELLRPASAYWPAWHVYFSDERCLRPEDSQRNSRMAAEAWLDHVPIPSRQVHAIPAETGPSSAAKAYGETLSAIASFDFTLLGLGEDGHTASLFPGHEWGQSEAAPPALPVLDAPKPPPERVSLSARRLSDSRRVVFLVTGSAKRDAVDSWRNRADIPARAIRPAAGVDVMLDEQLQDQLESTVSRSPGA